MAIVLSLCAALAYGLSDFVGGVVSRRISPWTIAFMAQLGGALAIVALSLLVDGSPRGTDVGWALLAGLGNGVGTAFLYRGLSAGRMGVVAPISGVGAALVPLLVGLLTGERPGLLAWTGIVAALPAIWLVAREPTPDPSTTPGPAASGVVDGVLAGLGFGVLFAALGQIPEESGLLPLALNQLVGTTIVAGLALAMGHAFWPRQATAYVGMVSGVLGAAATVLFLLATQTGLLTISAVITSLYPAFTVLLAAALLRERIHRDQGIGLVLCAVAVGLITVA
ncbi:DMT family transporter [Nocardioides sp.]|uniref:DMT family transporter n=1 Tax=Nocardioides sp. TaxID=35761 RepID=UPI000C8F4F8F|nr:EamA family transporter [Pimelobacter sp.]